MVSAITYRAKGIINSIVTPVKAKDALGNSYIDTMGLWDTGAQNSAITREAAEYLGLKVIQKTNVRGVHGIQEVNVYLIEIILNNPNISLKSLVTECNALSDDNSVGLLLGMNVISKGDFSISNFNGHTTMTFRVPSLETKDFVKELNEYNKYATIHSIQKKNGIKKCPCGSGKDYKNCHGKNIYNK